MRGPRPCAERVRAWRGHAKAVERRTGTRLEIHSNRLAPGSITSRAHRATCQAEAGTLATLAQQQADIKAHWASRYAEAGTQALCEKHFAGTIQSFDG